jgi:hypothetical protein
MPADQWPAIGQREPCEVGERFCIGLFWVGGRSCAGCRHDGFRTVYTDAEPGSMLLKPDEYRDLVDRIADLEACMKALLHIADYEVPDHARALLRGVLDAV